MSLAPRSPGSGTNTPSSTAEEANGYLLLTIQDVTTTQIYAGEAMTLAKGEMRLECISLPIPADIGYQTANPFSPSPNDPKVPTHDFWLVLRVGPSFEMPLMPEQYLNPSEDTSRGITYSLASPTITNASLQFTLPLPNSAAAMEDLDSFEVLLRQYGSLRPDDTALTNVTATPLQDGGGNGNQPLPEEMRGKVVLVNQDNGEVVGELSESIDVETDGKVALDGKDKPVILDFGNEIAGYAPKVKVQTVPEDELDDWMLKSAHTLSKGILGFSAITQKLINGGTDMFVKNTKPAEKDVELGPRTKAGFRMAHNASVRTVNVTKSTVGMINDSLANVAEKTYTKAIEPGYKAYESTFGDKSTSSTSSPTTAGPAPPYQPRKPAFPRSPSASRVPSVPVQSTATGTARRPPPPPLPARRLEKVTIPEPASSSEKSPVFVSPTSTAPTPTNKAKRPLLNRIMLAGEVVLTSLEATAHELINTGTAAASTAAGHKFGAEAGHATALAGGAVRNVAVVYIDVRGIGRKALLKGTAKGFVKARLSNGETVVLQGEGEDGKSGGAGHVMGAGDVEERPGGGIVVGIEEIGGKEQSVPGPVAGSASRNGGGVSDDKKRL